MGAGESERAAAFRDGLQRYEGGLKCLQFPDADVFKFDFLAMVLEANVA